MTHMAGDHGCWVKSRAKMIKPSTMCGSTTSRPAQHRLVRSHWETLACTTHSGALSHTVTERKDPLAVGSSPAAVLREIQEATDRDRRAAALCCWSLLSPPLFLYQCAALTLSPCPFSVALLCSHSLLKSPSCTHMHSSRCTPHPLSLKHTCTHTSVNLSLLCSTLFILNTACSHCNFPVLNVFQRFLVSQSVLLVHLPSKQTRVLWFSHFHLNPWTHDALSWQYFTTLNNLQWAPNINFRCRTIYSILYRRKIEDLKWERLRQKDKREEWGKGIMTWHRMDIWMWRALWGGVETRARVWLWSASESKMSWLIFASERSLLPPAKAHWRVYPCSLVCSNAISQGTGGSTGSIIHKEKQKQKTLHQSSFFCSTKMKWMNV